MSSAPRLLIALAIAVLLAACGRKDLKPDLPTGTVVTPSVVYVDRYVYVAIPASLTTEQPIAEGPLSQCPDVAAARKAGQRKANAQLREIRAIQGTAVKP